MTVPAFRVGADEAEKAAARSNFARTDFMSIPDGDHLISRWITDHNQLITVKQHNSVPTRPAPKGYTGQWPQKMGAVCRNDAAFAGMFHDCSICNQYAETGDKNLAPKDRSWGLAVARKQRMENGRVAGLDDEMIEIERDGKKIMIPKIIVANFSWHNFWSGLSTITQMHGTWLSRDQRISRKGVELSTTYSFAAVDACNLSGGPLKPGEEAFDLRNPEHMARYAEHMPVLGEFVLARANDEFFARFFDTRMEQPTDNASVPTGGDVVEKPGQGEPSAADMAALAARVQGHPTAEPTGSLSIG